MLKQYRGCRIFAVAFVLAFGASGLSAQHLLLSVNARAGSACSATISGALDPQGTEARLRAVGFQITKARNATLAHEVDCTVDNRTVAIHQCLALSEFIAAALGSRAVQAVARWSECKDYTCSAAACTQSVSDGLSDLEALFATRFIQQNDAGAEAKPSGIASEHAPQAGSAAVRQLSGRLPTPALYYVCYILVCITVLFRWSIADTHAKHAK
jgi:hypothetical protein